MSILRLLCTSLLCLAATDLLTHPTTAYAIALPPITSGGTAAAGAGKRIDETAPGYSGTNLYDALYLPTNWVPGKLYPVIVEFPPNQYSSGTASWTGNVNDTQLGILGTSGSGYICVTMPCVNYKTTPYSNATTWWGDGNTETYVDPIGQADTAAYCKAELLNILQNYGGDPSSVFIAGFSRGAIATSYIGNSTAEMADIWAGYFSHSHYDGEEFTTDSGSAARLAAIAGRPSFITYGNPATDGGAVNSEAGVARLQAAGFPVEYHEMSDIGHTDAWVEDTASSADLLVRSDLQTWLAQTVANHTGTFSISGRVTDAKGNPIVGLEILSGLQGYSDPTTHFTYTDANGDYDLAGLVEDSDRYVTIGGTSLQFTNGGTVDVALAGNLVENFQTVPEPSTPVLLGAAACGLAAWRRRRRRCAP